MELIKNELENHGTHIAVYQTFNELDICTTGNY
jgi:hypothetical protein